MVDIVDTHALGTADLQSQLIEQSLRDRDFRARLIEDPSRTIEDFAGIQLPKDVRIRVLEETSDSLILVLPAMPERQSASEYEIDLDQLVGMSASQTHVSCCQCSSTSGRVLH